MGSGRGIAIRRGFVVSRNGFGGRSGLIVSIGRRGGIGIDGRAMCGFSCMVVHFSHGGMSGRGIVVARVGRRRSGSCSRCSNEGMIMMGKGLIVSIV